MSKEGRLIECIKDCTKRVGVVVDVLVGVLVTALEGLW